MATFFVLPPRELLDHAFTDFLARTLPSVPVPNDSVTALLDQLASGDRHVVHREDLPIDGSVEDMLCSVFGAEPGDRVVEIGPPRVGGIATVREWVVASHVSNRDLAR